MGLHSGHEGQVLCQVSTGGSNVAIPNIDSRLYGLMAEYGPLSSFTSVDDTHEPSFLVCFYDIRHAEQVVAQLDGQYVEVSMSLRSLKFSSDCYRHFIFVLDCMNPSRASGTGSLVPTPASEMTTPQITYRIKSFMPQGLSEFLVID